jgi:hypothetical protein
MRTPLTAKRLDRLADRLVPIGCDTCRMWGPVVYGDDQGRVSRPPSCPTCGREVPIRLTRIYIGVPLDLP